jgi:hypothetical protein
MKRQGAVNPYCVEALVWLRVIFVGIQERSDCELSTNRSLFARPADM